jgi:hypothetical protein
MSLRVIQTKAQQEASNSWPGLGYRVDAASDAPVGLIKTL